MKLLPGSTLTPRYPSLFWITLDVAGIISLFYCGRTPKPMWIIAVFTMVMLGAWAWRAMALPSKEEHGAEDREAAPSASD